MRTFSYFLSFFGFVSLVISSVNSLDWWSLREIKTKIIKMNETLEFLSNEIDEVKVNNNNLGSKQDQLTNQLNRWKSELQNEISASMQQLIKSNREELLSELKQSSRETNVVKEELKDLRVRLEQEVTESKAREISEMKTTVGSLQKSVFLTKPHIYSRFLDEFCEENEPDFTWTISDIRDKVKQTNFELLSEVFPLKGYSFGAQAKLTLNKDNNFLYIHLAYKNIDKSENALNLKLIPAAYFIYEDGEPSKNIFRYQNYGFTSVLQYDSFKSKRSILSSIDVVNDTISIVIRLEPSEATTRGYSYDGSMAWAIEDFRSKRERQKKQFSWFQLSPYFYTSPKGYRVQAHVFLNGFNGYQGTTIKIVFLTGPYDADLSRSFKHKTTVTLFHPTDPTKVIAKSVDRDLKDENPYWINIGAHAEVENVLDGDTLYYQIKIIPA